MFAMSFYSNDRSDPNDNVPAVCYFSLMTDMIRMGAVVAPKSAVMSHTLVLWTELWLFSMGRTRPLTSAGSGHLHAKITALMRDESRLLGIKTPLPVLMGRGQRPRDGNFLAPLSGIIRQSSGSEKED